MATPNVVNLYRSDGAGNNTVLLATFNVTTGGVFTDVAVDIPPSPGTWIYTLTAAAGTSDANTTNVGRATIVATSFKR